MVLITVVVFILHQVHYSVSFALQLSSVLYVNDNRINNLMFSIRVTKSCYGFSCK